MAQHPVKANASPRPDNPRRRRWLQLAAASMLPVKLVGCGGGETDQGAALKQLLLERWQARYPTFGGGLTLQMITPRGEYFASTIEGVTADSYFRGASTTKTFTAAAIMLLDQRGQLRIDDRLTATMPGRAEPYLPDNTDYAIPYKDQITIRQLLSHRAGVFDLLNQNVPAASHAAYAGRRYIDWRLQQDPFHTFTKDELAAVVATNQLSYAKPGVLFHYSDTHFTLLGKIIEQVSGLPLDVFKQRELLLPNGLSRTHFVTDGRETVLPRPAIPGYVIAGGIQGDCNDFNYSFDPGSGNVFTTPFELARWIRRLVRGEAGVDVARMLDVWPDSQYGLGIERHVVDGVMLGYGHGGTVVGYWTDVYHDPATDVTYLLQCSLVDTDDMNGQSDWKAKVATAARGTLGY